MQIKLTLCNFNVFIDFFTNQFKWRGFIICSKLSYGIYLTQFAVFHYNIGTERSNQHSNIVTILNLNEIACIICASIVLTLLIDYPFSNLKKIIFDSKIVKTKENGRIEKNQ